MNKLPFLGMLLGMKYMFGLIMSNFTHLMLCLTNAIHNFKWIEI